MEEIEKRPIDYLKVVFVYLIVFAFVGGAAIITYATFFETQQEKVLKHEIEFQKEHLEALHDELDNLSLIAIDLQKKDDEIYRNIFGAEQFPSYLREGGIGGADRYIKLRGHTSSEGLIETKKRIARLERKYIAQSKSLEELFDLARNKDEMLASIPAIQPVSNEDLTRMASGYGMRIHPVYRVPKMHAGMDFTAPTGTEIYATGDGVVERVQHKLSGYGKNVILKHGYGYQTLYGHMSKVNVREGQKIKRGEVIGFVGNTGTSVGPHLHYEVIKEGKKVNPSSYYFNDLSPEQYEELLERSQMGNLSLD